MFKHDQSSRGVLFSTLTQLQRWLVPAVVVVLCTALLSLPLQAAPRTDDADLDGVPDTVDLDDDNDGLLDISEITADGADIDSDRDGMPNRLDLDSDNDGILDLEESGVFLLPGIELVRVAGGRLRTEVGNNGVADFLETAPDSSIARSAPLNSDEASGDALPDYLDLDSDNDGLLDLIEAGVPASLDQNADGRIDAAPGTVGADGILDSLQLNNDANCCDYTSDGIEDVTPRNTDGMDYPDFQDLDSDNDGVFDLVEAGGSDLDSDGRVDGFIDNPVAPDGVDDALSLVPLEPTDIDADGKPDYLDPQVQAPVEPAVTNPAPGNNGDAEDAGEGGGDSSGEPVIDATVDEGEPPSGAALDQPDTAEPEAGLADDAPNPVQTGLSGSGGCSVRSGDLGRGGVDPLLPAILIFAFFWVRGRCGRAQPSR